MTVVLAQLVLVAWLLLELGLRSGDSAKSWEASDEDRNTTRLIIGAYVALALLPIVMRPGGVTTGSVLAWLGIAIATVGLILRVWAIRHLGRFYSRTLRVETDQHVVDDGPYKYIRHPGYLSSMLVWVGSRAAINLVVAAITLVVLAVVYARRIRAEEHLLHSSLGAAYDSYSEHTWRLVPHLW